MFYLYLISLIFSGLCPELIHVLLRHVKLEAFQIQSNPVPVRIKKSGVKCTTLTVDAPAVGLYYPHARCVVVNHWIWRLVYRRNNLYLKEIILHEVGHHLYQTGGCFLGVLPSARDLSLVYREFLLPSLKYYGRKPSAKHFEECFVEAWARKNLSNYEEIISSLPIQWEGEDWFDFSE